jgi:hypothetical protein
VGRHNPVTPAPLGTVLSHGATCGVAVASFTATVVVAEGRPGDVTSTLISPEVFPACTIPMHSPEKAFRDVPISDSCDVGSPFPTPISLPMPEIANVISLSVTGRTRPSASCTSTVKNARSAPFAASLLRSATSESFAALPTVSRRQTMTCCPFLKPRASIVPGAYFTFQAT